ncbi:molybdopterin-guanine dinucleotide biosynthesis protein MobA [Aeromicrobium sp. A1-2]|uniref:nucleotidyltransferase family protein n=1 Tax=Aeromicrobium sp. A1-2 TaxID=2107713 RepID=UPI000E483673|nr:nucleotidyltransferase family protein [Aeromicrobium sp. A1-2]AXT85963.1 molybdopterin-guanine dinucleotide biosynthesis protein MobA [Aeromicrobium sp. A1-2]
MTQVTGLLLAAGAGTRMGQPKALVEGAGGVPWVVSAARMLAAGGCDRVVVVIGAAADLVETALESEPVWVVRATDWADGMSASLAAGLRAIDDDEAVAALVHLVDLPDVDARVVRRLLAVASSEVLARADYGQGHGHPVLIGRAHWPAVAASVTGDQGARAYLEQHGPVVVDCRDLGTGADVDHRRPIIGS